MCAEGVAVTDGSVSTMKQTNHRGTSQSSFSSGMGAVDEEISAMLQSNHANMRQSTLTGVMAPGVSAPIDHFAAYPYSLYPPGNNGRPAGAMQRTTPTLPPVPSGPTPAHVRAPSGHQGGHQGGHQVSPKSRPPGFNLEEKYLLEAKREVLDANAMRNGVSYGAVYENPGPAMGLHRYHSAPATTFLAEMNKAPGQLSNSALGLYRDAGGLTSITENMAMDRLGLGGGGNNSNFNEYEHYMAPENDFARRLAGFPASPCKEEDEATAESLMRQTSMGLSQLTTTPVLDRMAENGSEKSSSRNSDDNYHLINGFTASVYSQEDFLWKSPTSPAKRQRGLEGESETSSGSADGSTYRNGHHGNGLVRHMSLPSSACGPSSPGVEDDSLAVPMRTRAKRGCATHPRSIAERVRRTKISERMKRLQDLVPEMDKQTNTSDMLDETVEYVKSLQRQVQELTETVTQLQAAAAKRNNNPSFNTNLELGQAMEASG